MYKIFLKIERLPQPIKVFQEETSTDFSFAHIDRLF